VTAQWACMEMSVDLRQLEHFVAVAEERHFTRAASRLNIVQSGLSASIRALEEEMGAPLFLRTTRRVNLTSAGQAFLEEANRVLAAARVARNVVVELQGLKRGRLKIGAIQGLAPFIDLPKLLGDFHREFPNVEILLGFDDTGALIDGVLEGRFDLAFTQFVEALPAALTASMLACDPLVIACPKNHALAGRQNLRFAEIAQEAFIDLPSGHGTRQLVEHCFAEAGLHRKSKFEVNDLSMQLDMVAHGLGIALVPDLVVQSRAQEGFGAPLGFASLAEPEACWELGVVFSKDIKTARFSNAAASACLDLLLATHPQLS
jgi:DNA-binding transcriptional LysR family regulator